ncbi:MAG: PEP-CTERM sorting domain-containing protein [Armatimonadota bacterium]|nr:PEP-CTERM sorting domain-containing protein [Armatimonadota bacterium]
MVRFWKQVALVAALLAVALPLQAQDHGHEGDLKLGYNNGILAILSPDEFTQEPYWLTVQMQPTGLGPFVVDIGIDFAHEHEGAIRPQNGEPMLKRVTLRQLFVTPGLFGVVEGEAEPVFGVGTPGSLTLVYDPEDPESVHKHIIFSTSQFRPASLLQFQLVDGIAYDGTPLGNSLVYTIKFEPVPEPATIAILGAGVGMLLLRRRRTS